MGPFGKLGSQLCPGAGLKGNFRRGTGFYSGFAGGCPSLSEFTGGVQSDAQMGNARETTSSPCYIGGKVTRDTVLIYDQCVD